MRFAMKPRGYQAIVAIVALFLISGTAFAAASFTGQGIVVFDSIKVGKNDSKSEVQLQGPIKNPGKYPGGKSRPINVSDDLVVKGGITAWADVIGVDARFTGTSTFRDLTATRTTSLATLDAGATTLSSLNVTGTTGFAGTATVAGTLDIRGALVAGPYNVGTTITSNAALTNRLASYVNCIATFAQLTTYSESEDVIFCFNTWMAGQPGTVAIASQQALTDLQRAEVEKARTMLSADPVLSMPSGFAPLK